MWLYVCIEGLAVVAEEAKDPSRTVPRGYSCRRFSPWWRLRLGVRHPDRAGVGDPRKPATIDYPLLAALGSVLSRDDTSLTRLFCRDRAVSGRSPVQRDHRLPRQIPALARSRRAFARLAVRGQPASAVRRIAALIAGGLVGIAWPSAPDGRISSSSCPCARRRW